MIVDALTAEFDQEMTATRKFLERVPQDKLDWAPHEKSMTLGQLALHCASTLGQVAQMATENEVPAPDFGGASPKPGDVKEILAALDESIATVQKILPTFSDERMMETWKATKDGQALLTMPRAALLRSILLNHHYHHRGQLSVYLRELGVSVPSAYGPSADEMPDFLKA